MQFSTYSQDMKQLMAACGCNGRVYEVVPKVSGNGAPIQPVSKEARRRVDELSKERGYRRFVADVAPY